MKRRHFFSRLAAGIAGVAIAPRVAAELGPDPEKVHKRIVDPPGPFTISDFDEALLDPDDRYIFSGKRIAWNAKGEIICERESGCTPHINDMVIIQLLWNNNEINISAWVTAIVGMTPETPASIRLTTLDKDAPKVMDDIIDNGFHESVYWAAEHPGHHWAKHAAYFNEDHRTVFSQFAYRGIIMANAYSIANEPPAWTKHYQYPMTYDEAYPKTTGGIWPHLDEIAQDL